MTMEPVRTNKKKFFSVCFQSTGLRNNSNNLPQISHSLLFSMTRKRSLNSLESCHKQQVQSGQKTARKSILLSVQSETLDVANPGTPACTHWGVWPKVTNQPCSHHHMGVFLPSMWGLTPGIEPGLTRHLGCIDQQSTKKVISKEMIHC